MEKLSDLLVRQSALRAGMVALEQRAAQITAEQGRCEGGIEALAAVVLPAGVSVQQAYDENFAGLKDSLDGKMEEHNRKVEAQKPVSMPAAE
jgi:hypothetical protein